MLLSALSLLRDGRKYMTTWPMVRQLGYFFPEYRIVKATQLGLLAMPVLGLVIALSQLYVLGWSHLPQIIAFTLFFISLPLQGLIWLGWRSRHPLPLFLYDWSQQLSQKLTQMGVHCQPLNAKANYQDLAVLLKLAFERFDQDYWDEL